MYKEQLKNSWKKEEEKSFQGWDFSYLNDRWEEEPLPWNYESIVKEHLKPELKLLDMGTGGGEFLLKLGHPYKNTCVTEAYEPNVILCKEKLTPLGIGVLQVTDDDQLPFSDNTFDIIINRHESYCLKEINRILKPGGLFITQQVGGKNNENLSKRLLPDYKSLYPNHYLSHEISEFEKHYFDVLYKKEYFPYLRFYDTGALVYYAKIIEWEFPRFSVDNCLDMLYELNQKLEKSGFIEAKEHRFIMVAKNGK